MKLVFVLLFSFILIEGTYSQRVYKMADYEGFDNETEWFVDELLYQSYKKKDYVKAAMYMDSLFVINASYARMNILKGAKSYDNIGEYDKCMNALRIAHKANIDFCLSDRTSEWSAHIQSREEFKNICPEYPLSDGFLPASHPEYRDSIIKYFIWQAPPNYRNQMWIDLGYGEFYETIPSIGREQLFEIIFQKYDDLISTYGFPTTEMLGSDLVQRLAYITVAHNPDLEYLIKHQESLKAALPPKSYALIVDKIRVAEGRPQVYGTQASVCASDGKPTALYIIEDEQNVNARRMKVGLHPLEFYEQEIQKAYNVDWSKTSPKN